MVLVLKAAGEYEHLKPESRKELLAYLDESRENPDKKHPKRLHLAPFMNLYKACKKHLSDGTETSELYRDLKRLNTFRNEWTHFIVDGWYLEVGLARVATLAGIKLVHELQQQLHLRNPEYQYSKIHAARYEIALSSLLRFLSIAEIDTILDTDDDGDEDAETEE